jgi:nuclear pore complex protein Nup205
METSPLRTWTPAVYETLQSSLAQLEDGVEAPLSQLAELLDICFPVFQTVLHNPPPSEADRQKLLARIAPSPPFDSPCVDWAATLSLGELNYKTNNEFRQCAETVSKTVNLNELYAASLVILSIPQAQKFDRSQADTAIYLHYSRRQYLLTSLLQIVRYAADPSMDEYLRKFLLEYVSRICQDKDGKTYPARLVEAMKAARDEVLRIEERQRNTSILRDTAKVYGDEDLKARKKLVVQEIDTLALILHGLVRLKFVLEKDIEVVLREMKTIDKLDVFSINLISPVVSWINQLCLMDDNVTADTPAPALPLFDGQTLKRLHGLIVMKTTDKWKLTLLGAYIQLHWLGALNGICKLEDSAAAEFTYETDILDPATAAAKSGGFDFAIKNILKPARQGTFTPAIRPEIAQFLASRKLPPQCQTEPYEPIYISQDSKDLSTYQLEHLVQLFISHLADVLKHIRLVEEDKALAEGSIFDYSEQSAQQHNLTEERDFTLEVIFLFISQLYANRPDSAIVFLTDADSALHGFLNWASSVKPVSMLWTFLDLCASIAEGPNCAVAVDKLFSADSTDQPRSKRFHQSWTIIFEALQYYAENLSSSGNANLGRTMGALAMVDRLELEEEATVILKAYLRLVRQVAANSHESKIALLSRNEERVLSVPNSYVFCD